MPRILLFILIALIVVVPVHAQQPESPNYRLSVISASLSEDRSFIEFRFGVNNIGGPAEAQATVTLTNTRTSEVLGTQTVPPLPRLGTYAVEFRVPVFGLPPGSEQSFQAGVDAAFGGNTARRGMIIPLDINPVEPVPTEIPPESIPTPVGADRRIQIPGLDFAIDVPDPLTVALIIGIAGIGLILLWILTVILRALFPKPPKTFGAWQPPYAAMTVFDPNSPVGRQQLWQPHAQNDAVIGPCSEGNYQIRKLLLGSDNKVLSGWKITGLRLSQYDMYGRVARSQYIAPDGVLKQMNRVVRKSGKLDEARAVKQMRPVANDVISTFQKRLTKRSAMLPLALDLRWSGPHGDVKIVFELYGCNAGRWQIIDQWEPEVIVVNGAILENFTYTIFGQKPDEKQKVFTKRLREDLTRTLAEMVTRTYTVAQAPVTAQTPEVRQPMLPQDTAPIPPVGE